MNEFQDWTATPHFSFLLNPWLGVWVESCRTGLVVRRNHNIRLFPYEQNFRYDVLFGCLGEPRDYLGRNDYEVSSYSACCGDVRSCFCSSDRQSLDVQSYPQKKHHLFRDRSWSCWTAYCCFFGLHQYFPVFYRQPDCYCNSFYQHLEITRPFRFSHPDMEWLFPRVRCALPFFRQEWW